MRKKAMDLLINKLQHLDISAFQGEQVSMDTRCFFSPIMVFYKTQYTRCYGIHEIASSRAKGITGNKQDGRHRRFFAVMKSAYISLIIGPRG